MEKRFDLMRRMGPGGKILLGVGFLYSVLFAPGLVAQEDAVRMRVIL